MSKVQGEAALGDLRGHAAPDREPSPARSGNDAVRSG